MTHIVITGFAPFGGEDVNPSWLAIQQLRAHFPDRGQVKLTTLELPVTFDGCFAPLAQLLQHTPADLILCVGQAGGRAALCLEKVAINYQHARIADNAGAQPFDQAVIAHAPTAYFSTLPLAAMLHACHAVQVPATVSYTAGTFVCNALFYKLMHFLHSQQLTTAAGFVHIPYAPMQVLGKQEPSMATELVSQGLLACVEAFLAGTPTTMSADIGTFD